MKKTLLILGGIALICGLLVFRLVFKQQSSFSSEREWFAKSVRYEFSARVDTIWRFNESTARLRCVLTEGRPKIHLEDSLKPLFKEHDMLYLIYERSGDSLIFILPNHASKIAIGDSLCVSSQQNSIRFFRDGNQVAVDSLSEVLTGFGRPFFMKRKKS